AEMVATGELHPGHQLEQAGILRLERQPGTQVVGRPRGLAGLEGAFTRIEESTLALGEEAVVGGAAEHLLALGALADAAEEGALRVEHVPGVRRQRDGAGEMLAGLGLVAGP